MYLDPIHWVMDNSGLSLLQRESEKERHRMARPRKTETERRGKEQKQTGVQMRDGEERAKTVGVSREKTVRETLRNSRAV